MLITGPSNSRPNPFTSYSTCAFLPSSVGDACKLNAACKNNVDLAWLSTTKDKFSTFFMSTAQVTLCLAVLLCLVQEYSLLHSQESMPKKICSLFLQVFTQPWYAFVESTTYKYVPKNFFTHKEFVVQLPGVGTLRLTLFRLIWRTLYVCFTTGTPFPAQHAAHNDQRLARCIKASRSARLGGLDSDFGWADDSCRRTMIVIVSGMPINPEAQTIRQAMTLGCMSLS